MFVHYSVSKLARQLQAHITEFGNNDKYEHILNIYITPRCSITYSLDNKSHYLV